MSDRPENGLEEMDLGTKFLMGAYITVAVFLSVIPFSIYIYLICKKSKLGRSIKRSINKCRGKELVDEDGNSYVDVLRWPYPSRDTEEGISNSVFMINLPSYEEVMKNKDMYHISSDIKVFYSVHQSHDHELDTGVTFSNELQRDAVPPANDPEQSNTQSNSIQLGDSQTDAMQPNHPEPDSSQTNHTQTGSLQPNHTQTGSLQHNHTQNDSLQPNHTQTGSLQPNHTQNDSLQPNHTQNDSLQPNHTQNDSLQHNHTQTDTSQLQHPETESPQHNHTQTDSSQHNHTQNDSL